MNAFFASSTDKQHIHKYEQQLQLYDEQFQALHRASSSSDIQRSDLANKLKAMGQRVAAIQAQSDTRYANEMSAIDKARRLEAMETSAHATLRAELLSEANIISMEKTSYDALRPKAC